MAHSLVFMGGVDGGVNLTYMYIINIYIYITFSFTSKI